MKNLRKIMRKYYLRQIIACWLVFYMMFGIPVQVAMANPAPVPGTLPTGGVVVDGSVSLIDDSVVGRLDIYDVTNGTVINWDNFDIGAGATTQFHQDSSGSWVLNRVNALDLMATGINGTLLANGGLIIVNPRGIVFGDQAFVDARGFIASAMEIVNFKNFADAIDTDLEFDGYEAGTLGVINEGTIGMENITDDLIPTEMVYLVGKTVTNKGAIVTSPGGCVVMAAGETVYLKNAATSDVVVEVDMINPAAYIVDNGGGMGTGSGTIDAPGGRVILAAGDIYSTAIEGVESLRAESYSNVKFTGDIQATGDVEITAAASDDPPIDPWPYAGSADLQNVSAGGDLSVVTNHRLTINGSAESGGDMTLISDVDFWGGENLTVEGTLTSGGNMHVESLDITLGGDAEATGNMDIIAHGWWNNGVLGESGLTEGTDVWAKGNLTAGGSVNVTGNNLRFGDDVGGGDVRANGGNLTLTARTAEDLAGGWGDDNGWGNIDVASGGTLYASGDVDIIDYSEPITEPMMTLTGHDSLSIIAGGTISSDAAIGVTGSSLLMQQGPSVDTASYTFFNQGTTDLTLISDTGSVTSTSGDNAANKWKSIGAHANQNITLARSDGKNEITLGDSGTTGKSLWAENGYIDIDGFNVENSDDFADWNLEAGTTLSINVVHGIKLGGDVTTHSGDMELLADTDKRYGWDVVVAGDIDSGGKLNIEGTNVDIQSAHSACDMDIYAHGLYDKTAPPDEPLIASGDVRVHGALTTTDGHIIIEAADDFGSGGATVGPTFASPGDIAYSASGTIYLEGDVTANGSDHGDDIQLLSNTVIADNVTLDAYDDVYLKSDKTMTGNGDLYIIAGDNIELGQTTETDHVIGGSGGAVTTAGNLDMTAGDSVYAYGKLMTTGTAGTIGAGDLTVEAKDNIFLKATPTSADAAGELQLIADSDNTFNGDLIVDGDLFGNMTLSGYDVTVSGNVTSYGTLDVDADDDIKLKANVSSVGAMTMDAGKNIELNRSSGNTSSESTIALIAGDDITIGKYGDNYGNVTANGDMKIWAGDGRKDDVTAYGKLTTTNGGNIDVRAGDDITIDGTQYAEYESVDADGTLTMIANTSGNGSGGGNLLVKGNVEGNMYLSGTDVTVDGTVTSFGTLDVDADDDIRLKKNVVSDGDMTMDAGKNITLNEDGGDTTSHGNVMTLNAGGDVTAYNNLITTGNYGAGNMTVNADNIYVGGNADSDGTMTMTATGDDEFIIGTDVMNGSIKIEGYAKSKYDMEMTAIGGNKSLILFDFATDVMNGSISIGEYAKSTRGNMTMSANGGDVSETLSLFGPDIVLMNGSIYIGDYAESKYDMLMTATGGSEGIDLYDVLDFDGMNGSIFIENNAKSRYGTMTMTAEGGSEYLTNDETDIDLMNGSIYIGGDATSKRDMLLTAKGGHELLTVDGLDVDGMNGSILIGGDAKSSWGGVTMTAEGGSEILASDCVDITGMSGSIKIGGDVTSMFHLDLSAKGGSEIGTVDKYDIDGMNGSIWIEGDAQSYLDGVTMTAEGGSEILTYDEWDIDGMNGSIKIGGDVMSTLSMDLSAKGGSDILTVDKYDIDGMNGSIEIGGDARALLGSMTMSAEGGSELLAGNCVNIDGMNGSIKIGDDVTSMFSMNLSAKGGSEFGTLDAFDIDGMNGSIKIGGDAESWLGGMTMTAEGGKEILSADLVDIDLMNGSIKIGGHVKSKYDLELTAKGGSEFLTADGLDLDLMNGSIKIGGDVESWSGGVTLTAEGTSEVLTYDGLDLDLMNGSIFVAGSIESQDDTIITAQGGPKILSGDYYGDLSLLSGDVVVLGDIQSYGGNVEIYSSDDTTYLGGDVTAYENVLLNNNTKLFGSGDQTVEAETGTLTANGYVRKVTSGDMWLIGGSDELAVDLNYDGCGPGTSTYMGNLWILGQGDIQISDDVTTFGPGLCAPGGTPCTGWETGGVAILSNAGKIYTRDGVNDDTLNVSITGNSDHHEGLGVYGPSTPDNKLAIAIASAEDLKIGSDAELRAYGRYYDDVDDRGSIDFLDVPATIGGALRDEGDPFDAAIYLASIEGDVDVSSPVSIMSREPAFPVLNGTTTTENDVRYVCVPKGAMVIDAYDTVTFDGGVPGGLFEASLAAGQVGDRLEVVSRITEWLFQAVGRLPYAGGGGPFPAGYNYVLRGAGLDNPGITDGRAWVLENPDGPAAPLPLEEFPVIEGCPVLMQAAALELGIGSETIQVAMARGLAMTPNIQPCDACANIVNYARVLQDVDGTRMAAMLQIFNEIAPVDAPFTPEMGTSIAMAFSERINDDTMPQYATAMEYVDAFVGYVLALDEGLNSPVGDSVAFVMGKYGDAVTASDNPNIGTFIATRLEATGG